MDAPPKTKRPGVTSTRHSATEIDYGRVYQLLRILQAPFGAVYWSIEQRCARIETRTQNDMDGRLEW